MLALRANSATTKSIFQTGVVTALDFGKVRAKAKEGKSMVGCPWGRETFGSAR